MIAFTYQLIIDHASRLADAIHAVTAADRGALNPRHVAALDLAASMAGVAAWIARDRRDAIMPEADDDRVITLH